MDAIRQQWETRYAEPTTPNPQSCEVLAAYRHLLPRSGDALDLACGKGGNAFLLARHGLRTAAWDIAENALCQLQGFARQAGLEVRTRQRDALAEPPAAESFDVIVVCRFLERALAPALQAALRPGGLLFYQTFTRLQIHPGGPRNPAYRLERNELLHLFTGLQVAVYREEADFGTTGQGWRDQAMLIAARPLDNGTEEKL